VKQQIVNIVKQNYTKGHFIALELWNMEKMKLMKCQPGFAILAQEDGMRSVQDFTKVHVNTHGRLFCLKMSVEME
jgi:hypothetical protein